VLFHLGLVKRSALRLEHPPRERVCFFAVMIAEFFVTPDPHQTRETLRGRVARMASWTGPEQRPWLRLIPALAILIVGLLASAVAFRAVRLREISEHHYEFGNRATWISQQLQRQFELPVEVLRSVRAFFDASESVTREEFDRFVADALRRYPSVSLLEWAPLIADELREKYEAGMGVTYPGFTITELQANGTFTRAAQRREYYPLTFMAPADDTTALGFDLLSEATRRSRVRLVVARGVPLASPPFVLAEDPADQRSIAVYLAVYDDELPATEAERVEQQRGLAIAIFRLNALVERAISSSQSEGLGFRLLDVSDGATLPLFERSWSESAFDPTQPGTVTLDWEYASRQWRLEFVNRTPVHHSVTSWLTLMLGAFVTILGSGVMAASTTISHLRREVEAARRLGQYTLLHRLGEGGMGVVYAARHAFLRRPTAIKLLQRGNDATSITRFEREVQLTARLTHPNTIAIYDFGRTDAGDFYYAMEWLDGVSFEGLVRECGPLPASRVVFLIRQVLGALSEAHSVGLIHRDIKPANLMVSVRGGIFDFVKVLDFGLVKEMLAEEDTSLTHTRIILGTPQYLSPEAILSTDPVDGRADLYAVGAVAYYLLTGSPVFPGPSVVQVCFQHVNEQPIPPSRRCVLPIPEALDDVILKALAKKPDERFASAREFVEALDAVTGLGSWAAVHAEDWWLNWRQSHPTISVPPPEDRSTTLRQTQPTRD
jgi:serine/threonine protein kinase/CHASE1-domain containing sensor protein